MSPAGQRPRPHAHDSHGRHTHDRARELRDASRRSLLIALILISGYMIAELVGGIVGGSLALLADAGHMLTDAAAIVIALVAFRLANRPPSAERTFGFHRTEVLAAMFNALSLWLIAAWIIFEAAHRIGRQPEVEGLVTLAIGAAGLGVNLIAAAILHRSSRHSLNVEGAFLHVVADILGSLGVVLAGGLILAFGWHLADPIISIVIALLILSSSWRLLVRVFKVLSEATPPHVDLQALSADIEALDGVVLIQDLHAWTITSGYEAMMAHIVIDPARTEKESDILAKARQIASEQHHIHHVTIQIDTDLRECAEHHHLAQPRSISA